MTFLPGFLGSPKASVSKTDSGVTNGATYQFGPAAAGRVIAAAISVAAAGGNSITGVLLGGTAAVLIARVTFTAGDTAEIWAAVVPAGSSGAVAATVSGALSAFGVTVYAILNPNGVAASNTAVSATSSVNLSVPQDGVAIAVSTNVRAGGSSFTWSGLAEDTDFAIATSAQSSAASGSVSAAQNVTVTATPSASTAQGIVAASWSP